MKAAAKPRVLSAVWTVFALLAVLGCIQPVTSAKSSSVALKDERFFEDWRSAKDMLKFIDTLGKNHKADAHVFSIGKSAENRPIKVISIGPKDPKHHIFLMGTIHGREWISPTSLCYLAWRLLGKQGPGFESASLTRMLEDTKVSILPLLNPDGYEYTRIPADKSETARMWRKNRRNLCTKCERAAHGIDLNRNWGVDKVTWGFGATRTTSDAYQGKHPFSEPELKAIRGYLTKHGSSIDVFLDVHCCSAAILPPTYYHDESEELKAEHMAFAKAIASSMKAVNNKKYKAREREKEFSNTNSGIAADWIYGEAKCKNVFIVEARGNENSRKMEEIFFMETTQIVPVSKEVEAAFWTSLSRIMDDGAADDGDGDDGDGDDGQQELDMGADDQDDSDPENTGENTPEQSESSEQGSMVDLDSLLSEFGALSTNDEQPEGKSLDLSMKEAAVHGAMDSQGDDDSMDESENDSQSQILAEHESTNMGNSIDHTSEVDEDEGDANGDDTSFSSDTGADDDTSSSSDTGADDDTSFSSDADADDDTSSSSDTGADDDTSFSSDTGADDDTSFSSDADADDDTSFSSDAGADDDTSFSSNDEDGIKDGLSSHEDVIDGLSTNDDVDDNEGLSTNDDVDVNDGLSTNDDVDDNEGLSTNDDVDDNTGLISNDGDDDTELGHSLDSNDDSVDALDSRIGINTEVKTQEESNDEAGFLGSPEAKEGVRLHSEKHPDEEDDEIDKLASELLGNLSFKEKLQGSKVTKEKHNPISREFLKNKKQRDLDEDELLSEVELLLGDTTDMAHRMEPPELKPHYDASSLSSPAIPASVIIPSLFGVLIIATLWILKFKPTKLLRLKQKKVAHTN